MKAKETYLVPQAWVHAGGKKKWDWLLPSLQLGDFFRLWPPFLRAAPIFPSDMPLSSEHGKEEGRCLPWSAANLSAEEISQGAFVGSKPTPPFFIHPSKLEFVHTVPEMQNNMNLCFHGVASLKLAYFIAGNFCWRLPHTESILISDTKMLTRFNVAKISKQYCAPTDPQNLGRNMKRKYASCESSRFLYS